MFDVVTIGTATRDVFLKSNLFKIVHDPKHLERLGFPTGEAQCFALGGKLEVQTPVITVGGGAANAAVTFARQGFKTGALFKIGKDQSGRDVLFDLRKERITSLCAFDEKQMTAYSVILLSPSGERTILNYRGASEDLSLRNVTQNSLKTRWLYVVPGRISMNVIRTLIERAKKNGARIAINFSKYYLDMGAQKLKPLLKHVDVVQLNREEAAYLTGMKFEREKEMFKKIDEMIPGIAVMTDGSRGVMVSDGTTMYKAGIYKGKKIIDRTGAGDAFGSGFVAGLMHKNHDGKVISRESIEYAIRLASANATSVVEAIGAQPGILRKKQFTSEVRWHHLPVTTHTLS